MSAADRVQKLETLLARVNQRATEPRGRSEGTASAAHALPAAHEEFELDSAALESAPPPPVAPDRQVPLEEPSESRERLVAAEPLVDEPTDVQTLPPVRPREPVAVDAPSDAPEIEVGTTDAADEEPPVSSRRPIALEPPLEELAFGDAPASPPPPLTPPPESGSQVAAPAVDLDFEGDFTGVRPKPEEETAKPAPVAAKAAIAPEVVRPVLPAEARVAGLEGKPREFRPSTFGELLDAALDL